ncbi:MULTISPECIES: GNAT family N-acetyltransferase [Providencia]|uniref:GNAT family N-acetyltransferase n=1 Tax=Providencia rettgeri TaxID=587 RepID=A0AAE2ZCB3_PRORE|nr:MULTISPECIES: GNAT family N-acetyltransferase [Providencia]EFE53300.1 acetyltransferase, GNAT family [Providencia rettgeri DSM 1131]MRF65061.1 GNAT family N-acetyltransferase [Escherichia coli]QIF65096.1 GNAT family N-acetyltransferase [Providencia sp. 1709051003]EHZ6872788.1 GNAT family N-acetyltransferase [Providencia rettgeri]MBG5891446.1 GNAT family N-acetyltransferase [Providencia rettgeri]
MAITLKDITKDNWVDIICLEITKEQEDFVALNSESIAASKFFDYYINRGIYVDDEPVGFVQYYSNHENGRPEEVFIDQLMIDIKHQRKGFGSRAIPLVLEEIKNLGKYKSVSICYVEGNDIMKPFFEQFGFSVVEQDEFDETIMRLFF